MKFKNAIIDNLFVLAWTIWCSLLFVIALLIFFPIFFIGVNIPNQKVLRAMHFFPIWAVKVVLFFWGIKVKVHGKEIIDPKKQYIFIGNHTSYLDAFVSAVASDNFKKYIGKAEILRYPVLGYLLKKLYVPVQRDVKESRKWSMGTMHQYLSTGASMVIFPEGTCNTTDKPLKEFKQGAFSLSLQLGIPIAVATYINVAELMPRKLLRIRPGIIDVYWTKILHSNDYQLDNLTQMIRDAENEILAELSKH